MLNFNTFVSDFGKTRKEIYKDFGKLIETSGTEESKFWWTEWGWSFLDEKANFMYLGGNAKEDLLKLANKLWFKYQEEFKKNNLKNCVTCSHYNEGGGCKELGNEIYEEKGLGYTYGKTCKVFNIAQK